jgi:hypothetical protein
VPQNEANGASTWPAWGQDWTWEPQRGRLGTHSTMRSRSRQPARALLKTGIARTLVRVVALRAMVLLAALAVAMPALAVQVELFKCRYSGKVMQSCCCRAKAKAEAKAASNSPEVKPASCCDLLRQEARHATSASRDLDQNASSAPPASTLALVIQPASERRSEWTANAFVEARAGPPIFLRDCRLLTWHS